MLNIFYEASVIEIFYPLTLVEYRRNKRDPQTQKLERLFQVGIVSKRCIFP